MKYLVDINACIAILKGSSEELRRRLDHVGPQNVAICSVVKAELLYGARKSMKIEHNLLQVSAFCEGLKSYPFDDAAAEFYGINRAILERAGTSVGNADLFISSIALANDLVVLTRNQKEFIRVPGLKVETW